MPSPKSGKAGSPVPPAAPDPPVEAVLADPGQNAAWQAQQAQSQPGSYAATPLTPHKPPQTAEEVAEKNSWIEIELVGEDDKPIPGEGYRIELPDGTVASGTLDEKGFARVEGIPSGNCKISFPELDQEAWKPA